MIWNLLKRQRPGLRALILLLSFTFLCGGCAKLVRDWHKSDSEDLAQLMGSPEETGFLLIDCDMIEKEDKFLAPDETEKIWLEHCSIVKEGSDDQPIRAHVQMGHFFFLNLDPGRYCIKAIHGKLYRLDAKDDKDDEFGFKGTKKYRYQYEFPLWNVRDVIFEVVAGVPTYFGKIIVTEPYRDYNSQDGRTRSTAVRRVGKSEKVETESKIGHEKTAWKSFLWWYPESAWSEAVQKRLEDLSDK
jgi:hypothetical protein